ncbi:hypothetical protein LOD99_14698 [Oopsacas minuta]|uniref:Acetoacetyl-CoA synthetase n=1 Tax=Oopsacas minuta TaxID=111878 RepID=A0AAV7KCW9_9METZ|nr:hypothetical protein LOD99_14698 [Oopsacas minuta]
MSSSNSDELLWKPPADLRTNMDAFIDFVNTKRSMSLDGSYKQLYEWSINKYAEFWEDFYNYSGIVTSQTFNKVVDTSKGVKDVPEWFSGARLNFAENLLRFAEKYPDRPAMFTTGEGQEIRKITFSELKCRVSLIATALKSCGVEKGDKVVGYIPNCALAVEAMLASVSLGAIWSSASPDFGVTGVLDRFSQIKPKVMFSVDGVRYNNKIHMHVDRLKQVVDGLPEVERVIVMGYVRPEIELDLSGIKVSY